MTAPSRSWRPAITSWGRFALGLGALAVALASPAGAHDQPFSWADARIERDALSLTLTVHRVDAASALAIATPESLADRATVARVAPRLAATLAERFAVSSDGRVLRFTWQDASVAPARHGITLRYRSAWSAPAGHLAYHARLFPADDQHQTFVNLYQGSRLLRQDVLDARRTDGDAYAAGGAGLRAVLATFVPAGIHHIFAGPDHILFVVGLLLLGGSVRRLLRVVTGFTIAHSITLALAATGIVDPPPRVIEPLIALSIVAVGLDALRPRRGTADPRALMAFGFGLVHGFGFASVLRELGLPREALAVSLLGFNLGVEIGQACIVLAVAPPLALLRARSPKRAPNAIAFASVGVVAAGAFWFVQRVGGGG